MDEIGQRLDEVGQAVTRNRTLAGLADVRRRASRRRRAARTGTATASVAIVLAAGLGLDTLGDRDRTSVTTPAPTASPEPEPSPTSSPAPAPNPSPNPSPTSGPPSPSPYRRSLTGELPRAAVRKSFSENTWTKVDEGQQFGFPTALARFSPGVRPLRVTPTSVEVAFGAVWVPATDGVVRIDPETMQPNDFIPTGPVRAIASSGSASIYAIVETDARGLGVASWDQSGRKLQLSVLDPAPDAIDTVLNDRSAVGFGEELYVTRTYPDRPAEVLRIRPANGTFDVINRFGSPGTRLVIDRNSDDGARHLWVGGSDGVLRHIHDDGHVTELRVGGAILDLEVAEERVWLAVDNPASHPRPVVIDIATERVSADVTDIVARYIAIDPIEGYGERVWTSSGEARNGHVDFALVTAGDSAVGQPLTTWRTKVRAAAEITLSADGRLFAVTQGTGELLRLEAEFGE